MGYIAHDTRGCVNAGAAGGSCVRSRFVCGGGNAGAACGLYIVSFGRVVCDAYDVHGGCAACDVRETCVSHVAVAMCVGWL